LVSGRSRCLGFDVKRTNKVYIAPQLDVLFKTDSKIVGVESKCTEFVQ
jgi:hypothetical protein